MSKMPFCRKVMQIAVAMAGYEPGEADMIRKAVAKKKQYLMDKHQRMFRKGAAKKLRAKMPRARRAIHAQARPCRVERLILPPQPFSVDGNADIIA